MRVAGRPPRRGRWHGRRAREGGRAAPCRWRCRRSVALRLRYKECNGDLAGGSFVELAKTLADGLTFSDRVQFARVVTQPLLVEAEAIISRRAFPRGGPLGRVRRGRSGIHGCETGHGRRLYGAQPPRSLENGDQDFGWTGRAVVDEPRLALDSRVSPETASVPDGSPVIQHGADTRQRLGCF